MLPGERQNHATAINELEYIGRKATWLNARYVLRGQVRKELDAIFCEFLLHVCEGASGGGYAEAIVAEGAKMICKGSGLQLYHSEAGDPG